MHPVELSSTGRASIASKALQVPAAFILGWLLLVFALLLQVNTYAFDGDIAAGGVALALTINADACFL